MRGLRHGVRHHAVNADGSKNEREPGKYTEQQPGQPARRKGVLDVVIHCFGAKHHHATADVTDRAFQCRDDGVRITRGSHQPFASGRNQVHGCIRKLTERNVQLRVDFRAGISVKAPVFHVANHANDFAFQVEQLNVYVLAEGFLPRKSLVGKVFVNVYRTWRRLVVVIAY